MGSSYAYMNARDWLKFGQLHLNNGAWEGEQILPTDWVNYITKPTPASDGEYGAHFWLNIDGTKPDENGDVRKRYFPELPEDIYYFAGRDGQYVFIIPDKNMVITRLGLTRNERPIFAMTDVITQIYNSVGTE